MLRREERDFLDDVTLAQLSETLGVPVIPVAQDGFELLDAMLGVTDGECPESGNGSGAKTPDSGSETFYVYN